MILRRVEKQIESDRVRLTGWVQTPHDNTLLELFFEYPARFASFVDDTGDAWVPVLLLPCMASGIDLVVDVPVSQTLIYQLARLQDIFNTWFPDTLHLVSVDAPHATSRPPDGSRHRATFFSLGVDSFYTLLKHNQRLRPGTQPVSHLIYMLGLEKPLSTYRSGQEEAVLDRIQQVAKATNTHVIHGRTNFRNHFSLDWAKHYHGAGLAGTALSLSSSLRTVLIPSARSYRHPRPAGASPMVDHLWSTERTRVVHDGSEATRAQKIADVLVYAPFALDHVRVCIANEGGAQNCGACWKCIRTMCTLHLTGHLKETASFPDQLPPNYKRQLAVDTEGALAFTRENLELARERNVASPVVRALRRRVHLGEAMQFCTDKGFWAAQRTLLHLYLVHKPREALRRFLWQAGWMPTIKRWVGPLLGR